MGTQDIKKTEVIKNSLSSSQTHKDVISMEFEKIHQEVYSLLKLQESSEAVREHLNFFTNVHAQIPKGTKYRPVKRLAPIIIYLCLTMKGVSLKRYRYINKVNLDRSNFIEGLKLVIRISS